jgi:hypothetical protein
MKKIIFSLMTFVGVSISAHCQIQWNDDQRITHDVTVKQAFPSQNFNGEEIHDECSGRTRVFRRLFVHNLEGAQQEVLLRVNISGLEENLTTILRVSGSQSAEATVPMALEVFASRDIDWTENSATWSNTRAIEFTDTPVARRSGQVHSWNGTYINFIDAGLQQYIKDALADGVEEITLAIRSATPDTENWFFIWSKEQEMAEWCSGGNLWTVVPKSVVRNSDVAYQQAADATVSRYEPDREMGAENALNAKIPVFAFDANDFKSFIRFNLEKITQPVSAVKIHLRGRQGSSPISPYNINFHATSNNWEEMAITWNNCPVEGKLLATVNVNTNQTQWWEVSDVRLVEAVNSALMAGESDISLAIVSGTKSAHEVWFESKELNRDCGIEFSFNPIAVSPVIISPNGGDMSESVEVTLASVVGQTIYYSLDGSMPTANSLLYSQPILLSESAEVKAVTFKDGYPSGVTSATFTLTGTGTGITEPGNAVAISLWPNPATDFVVIEVRAILTKATIEILDLSGRVVSRALDADQTEIKVPLAHLANGMYLIQVYDNAQIIHSSKFIKTSN